MKNILGMVIMKIMISQPMKGKTKEEIEGGRGSG